MPRTFGPSIAGRIGVFVVGSLVSAALIIWLVFPLLDDLVRLRGDARPLTAIALITVTTAFFAAQAFWFGYLRVVVTDDLVEVCRGGKAVHTWPRASTTFGSYVVRQSTNGIPSGATRTLIAANEGGETRIPLGGYSAATFSALIALLRPIETDTAPTDADEVRVAAGSSTSTQFRPDSSKLRKRGAILLWVLVAAVVVTALVAFALIESDPFTAIVVGSAVPLILIVGLVVVGISQSRINRRVPNLITVGSTAIIVDEHTFPYDSVRSIRLTPPTYTNSARRLEIVEESGRRHRYLLGMNSSSPVADFLPTYPDLVRAVASAASRRPGLVAYDLA